MLPAVLHRDLGLLLLVQFEDVDGLGVGAEGEVVALLAEGEAVHVGTPLHAAAELHQPRPVLHAEDADDGPPLGSGGQLGAGGVEGDGSQRRVVCRDH